MQPSRTKNFIGWILSGLVSLFLLGASGIPKFFDFPGKGEMMEHLGISLSLLPTIAAVEIAVAVIYYRNRRDSSTVTTAGTPAHRERSDTCCRF